MIDHDYILSFLSIKIEFKLNSLLFKSRKNPSGHNLNGSNEQGF